jgi:hypothetical protein
MHRSRPRRIDRAHAARGPADRRSRSEAASATTTGALPACRANRCRAPTAPARSAHRVFRASGHRFPPSRRRGTLRAPARCGSRSAVFRGREKFARYGRRRCRTPCRSRPRSAPAPPRRRRWCPRSQGVPRPSHVLPDLFFPSLSQRLGPTDKMHSPLAALRPDGCRRETRSHLVIGLCPPRSSATNGAAICIINCAREGQDARDCDPSRK